MGPTPSRLEQAREVIADERLDALLVFDLLNIRYLCGFTGSNGLLLLSPERALLYTDSRYNLQAREEVQGAEVVEASDLDVAAAETLNRTGAGYLGYESADLTVSRWRRLQSLLKGATLLDIGPKVDGLRRIKEDEEVRLLREAALLAEAALVATLNSGLEGRTEAEFARSFHLEALRRGADALSFDTIVAGGPRGALPQANPGERTFSEGDLVVVDFGVKLEGYCSDETLTLPVGRVQTEAGAVYETVRKAQAASLAVVRPGVPLEEVDRAGRIVVQEAGYGTFFGHSTGHGVGLAAHEAPSVGPRSKEVAECGMVFTVEPGIYLPGRFGVRLEDTIIVTPGGYERLTTLPKEFGALHQ